MQNFCILCTSEDMAYFLKFLFSKFKLLFYFTHIISNKINGKKQTYILLRSNLENTDNQFSITKMYVLLYLPVIFWNSPSFAFISPLTLESASFCLTISSSMKRTQQLTVRSVILILLYIVFLELSLVSSNLYIMCNTKSTIIIPSNQ